MYVIHVPSFRRRLAAIAAMVVMAAAAAVLLGGCFGGEEETAAVTLPDDAARTAYLQELGWQVEGTPMETLDLQLPEVLEDMWSEYTVLQQAQGFPFDQYAGQAVRRYTYRVNNYPGIDSGVQANLYLCGDVLIGGDIIAVGKGGFQSGLQFPAA